MTWLTRLFGSEADRYEIKAMSLAKSTLKAGIAADSARMAVAKIAADGHAIEKLDPNNPATWGQTVYTPEYLLAGQMVDRLEAKRTELAEEAIAAHYISAALARKEGVDKPTSLNALAKIVAIADIEFDVSLPEALLFFLPLLGGGLAAAYYFDICQESKRATCDQNVENLILPCCVGLLVWLLLLIRTRAAKKCEGVVIETLVNDYLRICANLRTRPELFTSEFERLIEHAKQQKYGPKMEDHDTVKKLSVAIKAATSN